LLLEQGPLFAFLKQIIASPLEGRAIAYGIFLQSFPRKRESISGLREGGRIPAFAGMTIKGNRRRNAYRTPYPIALPLSGEVDGACAVGRGVCRLRLNADESSDGGIHAHPALCADLPLNGEAENGKSI
jgi:hypothetical protein